MVADGAAAIRDKPGITGAERQENSTALTYPSRLVGSVPDLKFAVMAKISFRTLFLLFAPCRPIRSRRLTSTDF
jgi:hypothetical protein